MLGYTTPRHVPRVSVSRSPAPLPVAAQPIHHPMLSLKGGQPLVRPGAARSARRRREAIARVESLAVTLPRRLCGTVAAHAIDFCARPEVADAPPESRSLSYHPSHAKPRCDPPAQMGKRDVAVYG